jgi:phospholipid/cholesterol/gamma-HCH transport system permease protein
LTETLAIAGRVGLFAGQVLLRALTPPWFLPELARQVWTTCARCMGPVLAVTLPFGMVISLQGLQIFDLFGAQRLLSSLVSVAVLRELAPVLASVLVAAQGGSSVAAELGAMRIKEEIDATEVMAVDSLRYHVLPRIFGLTLSTPMLGLAGAGAGLFGGWLSAVLIEGEPSGVFLANLWALTTPMDLWAGVIKTLCFGFTIGIIAAYNGYHTTGGASGVGRAVNDTVVYACLVFFVENYFLTSALFGAAGT